MRLWEAAAVIVWEVADGLTVCGATLLCFLSPVCPLSFHLCSSSGSKAVICSQQTNHHVFTWDKNTIQCKLTHNSCFFFPGPRHPPLRCSSLMGQTNTSCYLYLYSIFSLQLASTHSFHSNGLGGIEDWKWHTGHSVSLSPTFVLSRCHEVGDVWAKMSL